MRNSQIRLLCMLLCFTLSISLIGCHSKPADNSSSTEQHPSQSETINDSSEQSNTSSDATESIDDTPLETTPFEDFEDYEDVSTVACPIYINNLSKPVSKGFMGLNGLYNGYTYIHDDFDRHYTEEQAQIEFDRIAAMGVANVRTHYTSEYSYDGAGGWNWESDDMKAFYRWLKEMQKRDISISLHAGQGLQGMYTESHWAPWYGLYVKNDEKATIKNYSAWMVESLKQFRAHGINNIDHLILFTEPTALPWNPVLPEGAAKARDMDENIDRWLDTSKALHDALTKAGIRSDYKLVGPNDHNRAQNPDGSYMTPMFYHSVLEANDYIDIFSCHSYFDLTDLTSDVVGDLYDVLISDRVDHVRANGNQAFWIDETNVRLAGSTNNAIETASTPWHALHWGVLFSKVMNGGVQNAIMWSLVDQQWPDNVTYNNDGFVNGVQRCGILPSMFESSLPRTSYYGCSLLTKYFGNNAEVYDAHCIDFGLYAGAQRDENGEYSILVTNMDLEERDISLEFDKNIGKKTFYRHLFDMSQTYYGRSAKLIPADRAIKTSGSRMVDTIPSNCIAVYTTIQN